MTEIESAVDFADRIMYSTEYENLRLPEVARMVGERDAAVRAAALTRAVAAEAQVAELRAALELVQQELDEVEQDGSEIAFSDGERDIIEVALARTSAEALARQQAVERVGGCGAGSAHPSRNADRHTERP